MGEVAEACYQFRVRGQVQGVLFRASTEERATALGLRGWVENRADGSVSVVACGSEQTLEALSECLWMGPEAARVDSVEAEPVADPGNSDFSIV